jgi:hypothetical protein
MKPLIAMLLLAAMPSPVASPAHPPVVCIPVEVGPNSRPPDYIEDV